MSGDSSGDNPSQTGSISGQIDAICDQFEAAWRRGEKPRIEAYLGRVPAAQQGTVLYELLLIELELRSPGRTGGQSLTEEYRERFPLFREEIAAAFAKMANSDTPEGDGKPGEATSRKQRPSETPLGAARSSRADENLLLGFLALSMDFITREQLVASVAAWLLERSRRLGHILMEQNALQEDTHELLEGLVRKHLELHDGDPEKSIASLGVVGSVEQQLKDMGDAELDQTLDHVSGSRVEQASGTTLPFDPSASPAERFRILRPHAEGGLGRVSVAHDSELRREVAFKELRQRYADDPDRQCRFVVEAEITGSLEHPGVVPIYALGHYADGRPFYTMRLIRGRNMKEAIKQFHEADSAQRDWGKKALALRKLLRRFIDVCNAVQYAHSRGVLHRDLKPSNVMLGKHGETLVVDWGLAKLIGREEGQPSLGEVTVKPFPESGYAATQMGSAVGTPQYMSPEQAEGRLDELRPTSDVYSLGATLYEMLTGHPPFEGRKSTDVLRAVQQGDFPRPRSIRREIPAPLEAICLNAMALRIEDRYATAAAVAEDIEHWMADEPVAAHQEPLFERLARWRRRHRAWARAGSAALVLLAVVSVTAAVFVNEARRQEHVARQHAVQRLRDAREAVDGWLIGAANSLEYYPGAQVARKRLLQRAADDYTEFVRQSSDDPELELERGRVYLRLGDVHKLLDDTAKAEKEYRAAASLLEGLSGTHPRASQCRLEWANSQIRLGMVFAETGRHQQADDAYCTSIEELRKLAETDPAEAGFRDSLATALLNQSLALAEFGSQEEAEDVANDAVDVFAVLLEEDPGEPRYQAGMATARNALGDIFIRLGRNEEALEQLTQAAANFDLLVEAAPGDPKYLASRASSQIILAGILRSTGRYGEELQAYARAIDDYTRLTNVLPDVPAYAESLALTKTDLGQLLRKLGQTKEAQEELAQALSVFTELASRYSSLPRFFEEQAACHDELGWVLSDLGENGQAKLAHEEAVVSYERLAASFPEVSQYRERRAVARSHVGQALHKLGHHASAEETFREAIATLDGLIQNDPKIPSYQDALAFVCSHRGVLLREMNQTAEEEKAFRRTREVWQKLVEQWPSSEYRQNLAWFLVNCPREESRDPQKAIELAQQAFDTVPENAIYCNTLGAAFYRAEDWQQSVKTLREAIRLRGKGNARDWFFLAMALHRQDEAKEAAESYQRGCDWMEENRPGNPELKRIRNEAAELLGRSPPEPRQPPKK